MSRTSSIDTRLQRRLLCHQALHDPAREPRNRLPRLSDMRHWQAQRLRASFAHHLADSRTRPAAEFFLSDMYGDHDFSRRDADIARVIPIMRPLLPAVLLDAVADAIALAALSHAFDLRMAQALHDSVDARRPLDATLYARLYRQVGKPRLRAEQIRLIGSVGDGLNAALRIPGVHRMLRMARLPARALGLGELQNFLERGFSAFALIGDTHAFLDAIVRDELAVMRRLFAGSRDPFAGALS